VARYLIPLGVFVGLVALLAAGLTLDPRTVPSPLIGKPAPAFTLPRLQGEDATFTTSEMGGHVWLLNVWASWCGACRGEHRLLVKLAGTGEVEIVGLNYKDGRAEALQWLEQLGDPYIASAFDRDGRAGIDWGVYGVPETFVIDKQGVVRYKVIGPVTQAEIDDTLLPLVRRLKQEQS
jgi:cytochrome c biogenesis protein CcmG/thiol:disulfide interchange protein DsbE